MRGPESPRSGRMRMSLSPDNRYSVLVPDQVDISEITWTLKLYHPHEGWKSPEWMVGALVTMFSEAGITAALDLEEGELVNFFSMVRGLYWEHNDFHNFSHVFSVTHACYMLAIASSARSYLTIEDQIAIFLAGLCHDLDHHGVNSDFLIKTASPLAARYPRATLLEEHHLTETLRVIEATGLLRNLSDLSRTIVLDQLGNAVMATYMGTHAEIVELLNTKSELSDKKKDGHRRPPFDATSTLDRKQLVETIVHAADLSGQCMDKYYALESGKMIMMEFHRQHLREVAEDLPITPFMANLHTPFEQARCQLGFLVYVVAPLWRAMAAVFPELHQCYKNVEQRVVEIDFQNLDKWEGVNWDIMQTKDPLQNQREAPATRSRPPRRADIMIADKPTSSYDDLFGPMK